MLFKTFVNEIETKKLFDKNDHVVAAVSGGADSVCLLHLLCRLRKVWNFRLTCVHINHGIREEAEADAVFVQELCRKWDVPFLLHTENVRQKADDEKISLELAGREVRYRFLRSLGADVILTAHNKNDVAESILLHLFRGCGLDGLCGIPQKRADGICRPLLHFSREQIERYLRDNQLPWCEDSSNADVKYTRNRIRHEILPQIEKINPSFLDTMERMAVILGDENKILQDQTEAFHAVKEENDVIFFSVQTLLSMPIPLRRRAVRSTIDNFTDANRILDLLQKQNGAVSTLTGGKIAEREYENIAVYSPFKEKIEPVLLPLHGEVRFGSYRIITGTGDFTLPKGEYTVRTRENGDFFYPEGMQGRKKIGDFFTDEKIPRRLREAFPIITCDGVVAAVGTMRRSHLFVPENKDVVQIKIEHL